MNAQRPPDENDRPSPPAETLVAPARGTSPDGDAARSGWPQPFVDSELVAGRYRILRYLAAGAMGIVYEAFDQELGEAIAIKALRPEIAGQRDAVERFRREIQLARRVTHPNVCRIYDVGRHRNRRGEEVLFLSMELLRGRTLSEHLADGPLSPDELAPIARQVAVALEAAHRAGVVHRDLKSGNIFLEPASDGVRAVVTDFGLSRSLVTDASGREAGPSSAGFVIGTPAYLAPEQLAAEPVGPAADLYALGIVLYEALTGTFPFTGDTPLVMAMKRLETSPTPPSIHRPDLDPRWERLVLRCLERDPADRIGTARGLLQSLDRLLGRRRWWRWAAALAVGLLAIGATVLQLRRSGPDTTALLERVRARRSVAVLELVDAGGGSERQWLSTALAEMLRSELGATEELRLVSGETVARARVDLDSARQPDANLPRRLAALLGADLLVAGSFAAADAGGALRIDVRALDGDTGEILVADAATGSEDELFPMVTALGERLRTALGLTSPTAAVLQAAASSHPSSAVAARTYALGLHRLRLHDALAARPHLEEAVAADPNHAPSRAALAECWKALGHDQQAADEAAQAYALSNPLPRSEQLRVEATWREITGDWRRAAEVWSALWSFFPDDPEHGLRLVHALAEAADGERALAVVQELRRLGETAPLDPRVELAESEAAFAVGDYRRSLEVAERGVAAADDLGARQLAAEGRLLLAQAARRLGLPDLERTALEAAEGTFAAVDNRRGIARCQQRRATALARLGEVEAASDAFDAALATFRELGDERGAALVIAGQGSFRLDRGDVQGAIALHRQALEELKRLGARLDAIVVLSNLGIDHSMAGDLARAQQMFEESLALARQAGHRGREGAALNNLAVVAADQGDFPGAERRYREALALFEEVGDLDAAGSAHTNLGVLAWDRGDLGAARQSYDRALDIYQRLGDRSGVALEQANLAEVLLDQGDITGASRLLNEAIAAQTALDEEVAAAKNRALLARLAADPPIAKSDELERSVEIARRSASLLDQAGFPDEAAVANGIVAELLLVAGDVGAAAESLAVATALAGSRDNPAVVFYLELLAARRAQLEGRRAEARRRASSVLAQAETTGLARFVLDARLLLAASEEEPERREAGLEEVEADAAQRGYLRLAKRARSLRGGG